MWTHMYIWLHVHMVSGSNFTWFHKPLLKFMRSCACTYVIYRKAELWRLCLGVLQWSFASANMYVLWWTPVCFLHICHVYDAVVSPVTVSFVTCVMTHESTVSPVTVSPSLMSCIIMDLCHVCHDAPVPPVTVLLSHVSPVWLWKCMCVCRHQPVNFMAKCKRYHRRRQPPSTQGLPMVSWYLIVCIYVIATWYYLQGI